MMLERIGALLQECERGRSPFPPTELYSEHWLLRLVLDWFALRRDDPHPLKPFEEASWYSEAHLPSAFLPRYRGDRLSESRTHADAVVGHLDIGRRGVVDLAMRDDASQLAVVEGKIQGRLSPGVTNAPSFDQAARTVACMAEILRRAHRTPDSLEDLTFVLVAPKSRIDEAVFDVHFSKRSIRRKVQHRIEAYEGTLDAWFHAWFEPTLKRLDLHLMAWEDVIDEVSLDDMASGQLIDSFYGQCLLHHKPRRREAPERWTCPAWACPPERPV